MFHVTRFTFILKKIITNWKADVASCAWSFTYFFTFFFLIAIKDLWGDYWQRNVITGKKSSKMGLFLKHLAVFFTKHVWSRQTSVASRPLVTPFPPLVTTTLPPGPLTAPFPFFLPATTPKHQKPKSRVFAYLKQKLQARGNMGRLWYEKTDRLTHHLWDKERWRDGWPNMPYESRRYVTIHQTIFKLAKIISWFKKFSSSHFSRIHLSPTNWSYFQTKKDRNIRFLQTERKIQVVFDALFKNILPCCWVYPKSSQNYS